jgi:hypothetical protein
MDWLIKNFDIGFFVVGLAMVVFYLRLAQIRGHKRKMTRGMKSRSRAQKIAAEVAKNRPSYEVTSWWLVVLGGILMLVGVALRASEWFPKAYEPYWWVISTAGVLVFCFCFK